MYNMSISPGMDARDVKYFLLNTLKTAAYLWAFCYYITGPLAHRWANDMFYLWAACTPKTLDANRYATKKTIAQGMLDIALLTANASQLKYILQVGPRHEFYTLMLTLITVSIILQVVLGAMCLSLNMLRDIRLHLRQFNWSANMLSHLGTALCMGITVLNLLVSALDPSVAHYVDFQLVVAVLFLAIGGLNINKPRDTLLAVVLNDVILIFIFLITLVNVVISGFGMEYSSHPMRLVGSRHNNTQFT